METLSILLQAGAPAGGGGMSMLVMLVLMFGLMYFLMIRPQRQQQKKEAQYRASLVPGTKVLTSGGIYGTVKEVMEDAVTLEIAHNTVVKCNKNSIYPGEPMLDAKKEEKKEEK